MRETITLENAIQTALKVIQASLISPHRKRVCRLTSEVFIGIALSYPPPVIP